MGTVHALTGAMTPATSFRKLEVWQESMTLVEEIYAVSSRFRLMSDSV